MVSLRAPEDRAGGAVADFERRAREAIAKGCLPPPRPDAVRLWLRKASR